MGDILVDVDVRHFVPRQVLSLYDRFADNGYPLYIVGGCVRDIITGSKPHDWDLCTPATVPEMKALCESEGLSMSWTDTGEKHGTITIHFDGELYEVTTFRIDGDYSDKRHADNVKFTRSLYEDLARRDFTMNAMAADLGTGDIIDPYDGQGDIKGRKIVAVGNPDYRISEDALRMLRALRFSIKYGFGIDSWLADAIHAHKSEINNVSKERITDEFRKMFEPNKPVSSVFMEFSDLITEIIPEIKDCVGFWQNNKYHKHDVYEHMLSVVDLCDTGKFEICMSALLHDIGKPDAYVEDNEGQGHFYGHPKISEEISKDVLEKRFSVTKKEKERILALVEGHDMPVIESEKSMRRHLCRYGENYFADWFILKQADMDDHIYPNGPDAAHPNNVKSMKGIFDKVIKDRMAFKIKDLKADGNDIMEACGLKPGKQVGVILNKLLSNVIDGNIDNVRENLIARAVIINDGMKAMKGDVSM